MRKIFTISLLLAITLAMPAFATPTEADKRTVASKAYVDTKQDIIETGLVEFNNNPDLMLPAVTTYDSTSSLVANKIGILDLETVGADEGDLSLYTYDEGGYGAEMDNFIPTVRLIAESFQRLYWNIDVHPAAVNAYSTAFNSEINNWPANNHNQLVTGYDFAYGLALKQNKIPTGTAGNVVTYTGNAGVVGSVAVSSTENYDQQNQLTNGSNLANVQLVSTKQNKMVCAGWDSETHTDEHCWLWSIE